MNDRITMLVLVVAITLLLQALCVLALMFKLHHFGL